MEPIVTLPPFPKDGSVKSLGFGIIKWAETYLVQPDGPRAGEPFLFTREQIKFILWFYAVDVEGRFSYRRGVLRRSKGWGKSPFLAAICLAELCGPVRFSHFDPYTGKPVGMQEGTPWINLAGISETQTQNTMTVVLGMLDGAPAVEEYGIDVGISRIYVPGGGRLIPISASSATQEGARPTFAVMDETHHWTESNGGAALARVIRRNLAKVNARSIETTNAHAPGYDSVAERSYLDNLAMREGRAKASGLLYDSREAPASFDLGDEAKLLEGLACAYGDASWVDLRRLAEEIYDPSTPPEESRRFYLNQIVAAADSWVAPSEWDLCEDADLVPLTDGDTITLGFDGARTDDSTALVACRVSDGTPFLLGLWEKPEGPQGNGWEVDKTQVRQMVDHAFTRFDVVAFFADVKEWETDVDNWRDEYGEKMLVKAVTKHTIAYDMRTNQADTVRATEALHRAIIEEEIRHDGDLRLRRHVLNARRRPNRWGISFGKETRESTKKVDALAALILARMARNRVIAENVLGKRRGKVGRLVGF